MANRDKTSHANIPRLEARPGSHRIIIRYGKDTKMKWRSYRYKCRSNSLPFYVSRIIAHLVEKAQVVRLDYVYARLSWLAHCWGQRAVRPTETRSWWEAASWGNAVKDPPRRPGLPPHRPGLQVVGSYCCIWCCRISMVSMQRHRSKFRKKCSQGYAYSNGRHDCVHSSVCFKW